MDHFQHCGGSGRKALGNRWNGGRLTEEIWLPLMWIGTHRIEAPTLPQRWAAWEDLQMILEWQLPGFWKSPLCVCVCMHALVLMYSYLGTVCRPCGGQERALNHLELEFQATLCGCQNSLEEQEALWRAWVIPSAWIYKLSKESSLCREFREKHVWSLIKSRGTLRQSCLVHKVLGTNYHCSLGGIVHNEAHHV